MLALFLRNAMLLCAGGLSAWGVAALALRIAAHMPRGPLWWGALVVVPCLVAAAVHAALRMPGSGVLRAAIDGWNKCGGLIMAADEVDVAGWLKPGWRGAAPRVRVQRGRWPWVLLLSLVFALSCMLLPDRAMIAGQGGKIELGPVLEELKSQVAVLEEQKLLDEKTAEEMKRALEQAWKDSRSDDPARTWEELDHIQQKLERAAEKMAENMLASLDTMQKAEEIARQLGEANTTTDTNAQLRAMQELSDLMQQLAGQDSALLSNALANAALPGALKDALGQDMAIDPSMLSSLSPEMMKQLAESMAGIKGLTTNALMKLDASRLVKLGNVKLANGSGAG